jgi:murein DD-endopeptidase MepM/ murein hydrolase activator NlpD
MRKRTRQYRVILADGPAGIRRFSVSLGSVLVLSLLTVTIPVLIGVGAKSSARAEIERLRAANSELQVENGSYRAATGELTTQIQSLEDLINDLGVRAAIGPEQVRAMQKLPAVVRARAAGGTNLPNSALSVLATAPISSPEDIFGVLRDLLHGLESRLLNVRDDVERRGELAAATPSIWPAHGWLTGAYGGRSDPFTGEPGFHQGIDISTEKGQPVFATADGVVESASYTGDYGNLIILGHDFGLTTRYGHLSGFATTVGTRVKRGTVIGYVGATGRATGAHLHYEILANGQPMNPLQLLTQPATNR